MQHSWFWAVFLNSCQRPLKSLSHSGPPESFTHSGTNFNRIDFEILCHKNSSCSNMYLKAQTSKISRKKPRHNFKKKRTFTVQLNNLGTISNYKPIVKFSKTAKVEFSWKRKILDDLPCLWKLKQQ